MKPAHEQIALLDPVAYGQLYESMLASLLIRQLMLDQSGIADCVLPDDALTRLATARTSTTATLSVIECVCSDVAIHRSRIQGRVRGIPGWHEIDWTHVEHMRSEVGSIKADPWWWTPFSHCRATRPRCGPTSPPEQPARPASEIGSERGQLLHPTRNFMVSGGGRAT